jgi:hypothetical protein
MTEMPEKQADQLQRQKDPNIIDSRQLAMEKNERTAKQPQRELGEVPQDVVVPERFGNRYRFSSQVFWSASFWKFRPEDFR